MSADNNVLKGRKSEDSCCRYLLDRGYTVLERNYRSDRGEIDVIALKSDILSFIEVKTLPPLWELDSLVYKINKRKQSKIRHTAESFVVNNTRDIKYNEISFDVFVVQGTAQFFFNGVF